MEEQLKSHLPMLYCPISAGNTEPYSYISHTYNTTLRIFTAANPFHASHHLDYQSKDLQVMASVALSLQYLVSLAQSLKVGEELEMADTID